MDVIKIKNPNGGEPVEVKLRYSIMPFNFMGGKVKGPLTKEQRKDYAARLKIRKENNGIIVCRHGRQIDVINSK